MNMQLVPNGRPFVELVALRISDALLVAGRRLAARYSCAPLAAPDPGYVWSEQWRMGILQFCFFGDRLRYSQRRMQSEGLCTRQSWEAYTRVLVDAGVMVKIARAGCYWAAGWNRHRLGVELRHGMALPYPTDKPAPAFFNTLATQTQTAQRNAPTLLRAWSKDVPGVGGKSPRK